MRLIRYTWCLLQQACVSMMDDGPRCAPASMELSRRLRRCFLAADVSGPFSSISISRLHNSISLTQMESQYVHTSLTPQLSFSSLSLLTTIVKACRFVSRYASDDREAKERCGPPSPNVGLYEGTRVGNASMQICRCVSTAEDIGIRAA